jgi:hypothetical protein
VLFRFSPNVFEDGVRPPHAGGRACRGELLEGEKPAALIPSNRPAQSHENKQIALNKSNNFDVRLSLSIGRRELPPTLFLS